MITMFMKQIDGLTYMMWENTDNCSSHFPKGQGDVINILFCQTNCKYSIYIEEKQQIFCLVKLEPQTVWHEGGWGLEFGPVRFRCGVK